MRIVERGPDFANNKRCLCLRVPLPPVVTSAIYTVKNEEFGNRTGSTLEVDTFFGLSDPFLPLGSELVRTESGREEVLH